MQICINDSEITMEDSKTYFLQPGFIIASQEPQLIHIVLGSCVAVCLWDSQQKFGGACHYIYPRYAGQKPNGKFGDVAISHLIHLMLDLGSDINHLKAHIVGGGNRLDSSSSLGGDNAEIAEIILRQDRIKIVTKATGGSFGRKVIYNSMSGKILVYQTDGVRQNDWYE
jgi:chemotaxis protein CheD